MVKQIFIAKHIDIYNFIIFFVQQYLNVLRNFDERSHRDLFILFNLCLYPSTILNTVGDKKSDLYDNIFVVQVPIITEFCTDKKTFNSLLSQFNFPVFLLYFVQNKILKITK